MLHYLSQNGNWKYWYLMKKILNLTNEIKFIRNSGQLELVQILVTKEVNINAQDNNGNTALHYSAHGGN